MTEPDVALSDYAVTLECFLLTGFLYRGPAQPGLRRLFAIFFVSAGIGALAGGTVHGFFLSPGSSAGAALWRIALLTLGFTAFAGWSIGGRLISNERTARVIETLAGVECAVYSVVVLLWDQHFRTAIVNYLPSAVFLGSSFFIAYRRKPDSPALAGLGGVVLTLAAALVQRRQIALEALHIGHNTLYHLIQMAAFCLIFLAGRHFIAAPAAAR